MRTHGAGAPIRLSLHLQTKVPSSAATLPRLSQSFRKHPAAHSTRPRLLITSTVSFAVPMTAAVIVAPPSVIGIIGSD